MADGLLICAGETAIWSKHPFCCSCIRTEAWAGPQIVHATLLASESEDPRGVAVMAEGDGVHSSLALPHKAVAMLRQEAQV